MFSAGGQVIFVGIYLPGWILIIAATLYHVDLASCLPSTSLTMLTSTTGHAHDPVLPVCGHLRVQ